MEVVCHRCGRGGELTACEAGCGRRFHSPVCDGFRSKRGLVCYPCYRDVDEAALERVRRAEGEMVVRVVDGDGAPVPQARVAAGGSVDARLGHNRFTWHTPASGEVRIRRWLQPDPFVVVAATPARRAWRVVRMDEELRELELRLAPTYSITCVDTSHVTQHVTLRLPGTPIDFEQRVPLMLPLRRHVRLLPDTYWLRRRVGHWWVGQPVCVRDRDVYIGRVKKPRGGRVEIESRPIRTPGRLLLVPLGADDLESARLHAEVEWAGYGHAWIDDVPAGAWKLAIERQRVCRSELGGLSLTYERLLELPVYTRGQERTVVAVVPVVSRP